MALLLVIHQGPVDVGIYDQAFRIVLRKQFRILAPAKWRNLPSRPAVVRLHLRKALDDEFFSNLVRALVFLTKIPAKRSLPEFRPRAQPAHRFHFLHSPFRFNIPASHSITTL